VVGQATTASGKWHAFLYDGTTMNDLGTFGGSSSAAWGINDNGQVVGDAYASSGHAHAFLYSSGTMTDLGTLGGLSSRAMGINFDGQVVGGTDVSSGAEHAFLYTDGVMTDLNSLIDSASDWTLVQANAINDSGQIVGFGINPSGQTDAFLLTLVTPQIAGTIPEPSTLVLFGIGAVSLLAYGWRRRKRTG